MFDSLRSNENLSLVKDPRMYRKFETSQGKCSMARRSWTLLQLVQISTKSKERMCADTSDKPRTETLTPKGVLSKHSYKFSQIRTASDQRSINPVLRSIHHGLDLLSLLED